MSKCVNTTDPKASARSSVRAVLNAGNETRAAFIPSSLIDGLQHNRYQTLMLQENLNQLM
jgi:hypothetical protein